MKAKCDDINGKLEREAKSRDMIKDLKQQMQIVEKNVDKKILDCMDLMGNCKLMVEAQDKHIGKINKENQTYFSAITMFKGEIKDFENLLEEFRSIHDRDFL